MDEEGNKFRYTQRQRKQETKQRRYADIIEKISTTTKIKGKSIKERETEVAKHNSKNMQFFKI